jgi:hypothetical protein
MSERNAKIIFWIVFGTIWNREGFYMALLFFFACHVMTTIYSFYLKYKYPVEWKAYWIEKRKQDKEHPRWL